VDPLVLGVPRGGVAVALPIAQRLNAELNVVLVRKLRCSTQPELAIGAIDESGHVTLNPHAGYDHPDAIEAERVIQLAEIRRRRELLGQDFPPPRLDGRSVIVVDDGVATGSTLLAALTLLRAGRLAELIVAIPVAPKDRLQVLRRACDELICLEAPATFSAVGAHYDHFEPVDDEAVIEILAKARAARRPEGDPL